MEEDACAMLIRQIHTELEKNANNILRKDDLTLSQVSVLMELRRRTDGQMELKELEEALHVAKSTTVGIVRRLEGKGLVYSTRSAEDRRVSIIGITEQGKVYCRKAEEHMKEAERALTGSLTETERSILVTLLGKVRSSF